MKKIKYMAVVLATGLLLAGCEEDETQNNKDAYRQIGINCMQEGDYEGAIDAFQNALDQSLAVVGEEEIDTCYYKAAAQYAAGKKEDAIALVEQIAQLENVRIKGLMTIAPFVENPEDNRQYFRNIRQLSVDIAAKNIDNVSMNVLSMGMTGDYMVAIEEGATMVRVGTGIFGERNYNK